MVCPVCAGRYSVRHLLAIAIGFDVLANAILGGREYQTLSCRIGESILRDVGWAARIPWPLWFRAHCISSVREVIA